MQNSCQTRIQSDHLDNTTITQISYKKIKKLKFSIAPPVLHYAQKMHEISWLQRNQTKQEIHFKMF